MKKLLAIDMDGTLLNWKKKISKRSKATLMKAQKEGHVIVLATGRSYDRVIHYAKEIQLDKYDGYIASLNGSLIYEAKTNNIFINRAFDFELLKELFNFLNEIDVDYSVYKEKDIYEGPNSKFIYKAYRKIVGKKVKRINDIFKDNIEVNKVMINARKKDLEDIKEIIMSRFKDKVIVSITSVLSIEITARDGSKGSAVLDIANRLNISKENIWAFGNHGNDILMFEVSGKSIAMGNAIDTLKKMATDITESNNNDGVAKYLEKNLIKGEL